MKRFDGRAIVDVNGPVRIDDYSVPIPDLALLGLPMTTIASARGIELERCADPARGTYGTIEHVLPGATIAPRAFPDDAIEIDDFMP